MILFAANKSAESAQIAWKLIIDNKTGGIDDNNNNINSDNNNNNYCNIGYCKESNEQNTTVWIR